MSFKWNDCDFAISDNAYKISNLPILFKDSTYGHCKFQSPAQRLFGFVRNFHEEKGKGFFLSGLPDSGKSTAAACAVKQLIAAKRGWGFYVSFVDLLDYKIKNTRIHVDQPDTFWGECFETDLLILDDVGFEDFNKDTASTMLLRIFKNREQDFKSTILITQLSPKDFADKYGKSLAMNIVKRAETLVFG